MSSFSKRPVNQSSKAQAFIEKSAALQEFVNWFPWILQIYSPWNKHNFGGYKVIWFNKVQGRYPPVRLKVSWLSSRKSSCSITSAEFAKGIQIGACEGHDFAIHSSNICLFERKLLSWTRSCVLVDSYWYYNVQSWLECQATTLCR